MAKGRRWRVDPSARVPPHLRRRKRYPMPGTRLADAPVHSHLAALPDTPDFTPAALWAPRFPTPDRLREAAQGFAARPAWAGEEGPRPRVIIAAGSLAVSAPDLARRERTRERAEQGRMNSVDQVAGYLARGEEVPERIPSREITEWSRKSRANMVLALSQIDYGPLLDDPTRVPAMVTLTYPGDWLTVVPDGKACKRHLQAFRKRYARAWGDDLRCVWKLEFQGRGAPHYHLLMVPPHGQARIPGPRARSDAWVGAGLSFTSWLSAVWADIVAHPDPVEREKHRRAGTGVDFAEGMRARDPRRVAVYFSKHGSWDKEYQHQVPEEWQAPGKGPGRFWGYWSLHRIAIAVEVEPDEAARAARVARRWAAAQDTTRQVTVWRTRGGAIRSEVPEVIGLAGAQAVESRRARRRTVRRPVRRLRGGRGFLTVNDGVSFAVDLARGLDIWREPATVEPLAVRLARYKASKAGQEDFSSDPWRSHPSTGNSPVGASGVEPVADCRVCGEPMAVAVAHLGEHYGCDPAVARGWGKGWREVRSRTSQ